MHLDIIRDASLSSNTGTFGKLLIDGALFCVTCEQPWNDNKPDVSCIPVGDYELRAFDSPAHGHTFVFHNPALNIYGTPDLIPKGTAGRSLCEIHNANWPFQLKGCVGVGHQVSDIPPNGRGVTASVMTFGAFMGRAGGLARLTATISIK